MKLRSALPQVYRTMSSSVEPSILLQEEVDKPVGKKLRDPRCRLKPVHSLSKIYHLLCTYTCALNVQSASRVAAIMTVP